MKDDFTFKTVITMIQMEFDYFLNWDFGPPVVSDPNRFYIPDAFCAVCGGRKYRWLDRYCLKCKRLDNVPRREIGKVVRFAISRQYINRDFEIIIDASSSELIAFIDHQTKRLGSTPEGYFNHEWHIGHKKQIADFRPDYIGVNHLSNLQLEIPHNRKPRKPGDPMQLVLFDWRK